MTATTKDFDPIQTDYEFFMHHSGEAEADLNAYLPRVARLAAGNQAMRMLDFGCGSGEFTARFLDAARFEPARLHLTLVEPVASYHPQAQPLLQPFSDHPVVIGPQLPAGAAGCFDLAIANHVLYYVPDLEATLSAIIDALAVPGLFLTAIADRRNVLIQIWLRAFAILGIPLPHHTAEDVIAVLDRLKQPYSTSEVRYTLRFPDSEENRLKILRFLLAEYLPKLPRETMLGLFDPFARSGDVEIETGQLHIGVERCASS